MIEILAGLKGFWFAVAAPLVRSIGGWAQKSLADGEVQDYELRQLAETTVRVGVISLAGYFGFGLDGWSNVAISFLADKFFDNMKNFSLNIKDVKVTKKQELPKLEEKPAEELKILESYSGNKKAPAKKAAKKTTKKVAKKATKKK